MSLYLLDYVKGRDREREFKEVAILKDHLIIHHAFKCDKRRRISYVDNMNKFSENIRILLLSPESEARGNFP